MSDLKLLSLRSLVLAALVVTPVLHAQGTSPATTAAPATQSPAEIKAQKSARNAEHKQQKAEEKSADQNAKAAKQAAKVRKQNDKAQKASEKAQDANAAPVK